MATMLGRLLRVPRSQEVDSDRRPLLLSFLLLIQAKVTEGTVSPTQDGSSVNVIKIVLSRPTQGTSWVTLDVM